MSNLSVTSEPFPHLVVDGWWDFMLLSQVRGEFPGLDAPGWKRFTNARERKLEGPPGLWGPRTRDLFNLIEDRTAELEQAFGIDGLYMETVGGGYHLIEPGGLLDVHSDFSVSPRTGMYRRLNLLIYLNPGWDDPGGHLQLWDDEAAAADIMPEFNRTVVFATSATSWHGHPVPAARERRSVAAYFFTEDPPPDYTGDQSTVWHASRS